MSKKRKIYLGILALLIIIQFFGIDKTPPPTVAGNDYIELEKPPQQVATLLKNACYDCHSHQTKFPWYTNIQPLGWWIRGHIRGGRINLNFSEWGTYDGKKRAYKTEEMVEEIMDKHMPLKSYTWLHPEAIMTDEDRKAVVDWLKSGISQ